MVKFYVRRILVEKKMTIDEVPARWREAVRKELEAVEEQFHCIIGRKPIKENGYGRKIQSGTVDDVG